MKTCGKCSYFYPVVDPTTDKVIAGACLYMAKEYNDENVYLASANDTDDCDGYEDRNGGK